MDGKLVGWARAVKARQPAALPPLWLFSDPGRLADPVGAAMRLPRGLAGIVARGCDAPTLCRIARICRQRRLMLVVVDGAGLAGAGRHLRAGRRPRSRLPALVTSSAHDWAELRRARRAGAAIVFASPVFATASHPGAAVLGPRRWAALAQGDGRVAALGGIDGTSVRRLPRWCRHVGAIGALG